MTLAALALTLLTRAQDREPIFKAEASSAFVWGEDNNSPGTVSTSARDPITDDVMHRLDHGGIEVSSRAGFDRVGPGQSGELLIFTATIVNNTEDKLFVRQGGASIDGHVAPPLPVVLTKKGLSKKERNHVWELPRMKCFLNGFLPDEAFLSPKAASKALTVIPKGALTVSFVAKDPRHYSVLCSSAGCYPKGTIRFFVTVNTTDFVFAWPGRTMVCCGK